MSLAPDSNSSTHKCTVPVQFCPSVGDTLLFETGYFDASFALGILYIWIFTPFHTFFAHFHHIHSFLGLFIPTMGTPRRQG